MRMPNRPQRLSTDREIRKDILKIVITNDDGIEAPGLEALAQCVRPLGDVVVVAPQQPQSGIDGTPADCTRLALKVIAPDADWLISGINAGANLGSDVYNSGTVAAAREAAILGFRAIAVSQYIAKDQQVDWSVTAHHAGPVLRMLVDRDLAQGHYWNVNLPHPIRKDSKLTCEFCELDTHPHNYVYRQNGDELTYQGTIHERPRDPGKDVAVCFDEGKIAITRLAVGTGDR